ncbi:MAG: DUF4249 domain-containing protein [Bacteroidetes bacterium]|nr:DUF4249 domain-containing protein [Bacteroidota bacterium]
MKKLAFFIFSLALLQGCLPKDKQIVIPAHEPKLVVFSQVIPNSVMIVALAKSFSILDSGYTNDDSGSANADSALLTNLLVTDATVVISYQGKTDTLVNMGKGVYVSLTIPQIVDETYEISVLDHKSKLQISASERMLSLVELKTTSLSQDKNGKFKLNYSFDDPAGSNWYMINVYQVDSTKMDSTQLQVQNLFGSGENQLAQTLFFSDQGFSDSNAAGSLEVNIDTTITKDFIIALSNISPQYYSYLDKRKKSQNLFTEIFKEAINYPTNVKGGYGFFLTHHPSIKYIHLP